MRLAANQRIRLNAGADAQRHFFLAAATAGPGNGRRSVEQLARKIDAQHAAFGPIKLNDDTFRSFIRNFNDRVYGQDIQCDRNHVPGDGICGTFTGLRYENGRLLADMDWTDKGIETWQKDGFKYFSIDYTDNFVDPENKKSFGPMLFGAALTPRPFIKNMTPTAGPGRLLLSDSGRTLLVPSYLNLEEVDMKKFLEALRAKLSALKLSDGWIGILLAQFEAQVEALKLGDDEGKLEQLATPFLAAAKKLAEGEKEVTIKVDSTQLSEDAIDKRVAKLLADAETKAKQLTHNTDLNRKKFTDAIDAEKGLSDETKKSLKEGAENVTGAMSDDQVKRAAESAIKLGNDLEVRLRKAGMGLRVNGALPTVTLMSDVGSQAMGLMREHLMLSDEFGKGELKLPEEKKLSGFTKKVLACFDQIHGPRMEQEAKRLAGDGSTNIADGLFPVVAQRQVIIELLADLRFLAMVQTIVDPSAQATMQIPYEIRNTAGITNGAVVYEGRPIPYAGVQQRMDQSYVLPRKIAMLMSDEMIFFSRNAAINWDAWARNIASNSRLMRDIIAGAIAAEMQRSSDSYNAVSIATETLTGQANGTRSTFKTATFPVVRPRNPRDLQGNFIGTSENPIVVTYAGTPLSAYDGTGTQAAGNYYRFTDYNLGFFQILTQAGALVVPANATTLTIAYWNATNVSKFDIDVPVTTPPTDYSTYLNGLTNAIGRRKAVLNSERFVNAGFAICSSTLFNTISEAKQFEANSAKYGTDLQANGDLGQVKGIPFWSTNQPGIDLGDSRIILGEPNTCTYGIAKPFVTGTPFEMLYPVTNQPTGQKQAYGEEFSSIHVPKPIRGRMTSVVVYSSSARAAV